MTNLGLRVLELPDPSVLEGNIRQGGETQARGEGAPSATKDVKRQFFFNSQRVVAPATFPPLTANFNAVLEGESEREREREEGRDKWRNVSRSRPTDGRTATDGSDGVGEERECNHEVAKCKYAVNEWSDVWMDRWMDAYGSSRLPSEEILLEHLARWQRNAPHFAELHAPLTRRRQHFIFSSTASAFI